MSETVHDFLPCGIEYAVMPLPRRHIVTFQIRVLAGSCLEPEQKLGIAHLVEQTIDKGTERYSGQQLSDEFDAIGAACRSGAGRESTTFTCSILPEHFERAAALHAEFLRHPTFPEDLVEANVELARQELLTLEDDAQALTEKLISRQAYGSVLGRHPLGERETLDGMTRSDLESYWRKHYRTSRMVVTAAGAIDPRRAADVLQKVFEGFGGSLREGRTQYPVVFQPGATHYSKELEQEQIGICWPGVDATHADFPIQQVTLGILSGGMSGRLFTEVREKQGLVYWVAAWHETPRGCGMMFLGASTTPERCDQTYTTLLREVDRLADDLQQDEHDRAITGIVANQETRGDGTRARCGELAGDLFFYGHPVPAEEKLAKVQAVTMDDIREYLLAYPRDRLCVVTLGPRPLAGSNGRAPSGGHVGKRA